MASKKQKNKKRLAEAARHHAQPLLVDTLDEMAASGKSTAVSKTDAGAKSDSKADKKAVADAATKPWDRLSLAYLIGGAWIVQMVVLSVIQSIDPKQFGNLGYAIAQPPTAFFVLFCLMLEFPVRKLRNERRLKVLEALSVGAISYFLVAGAAYLMVGLNQPSTANAPTPSPSAGATATASPTATATPEPTSTPKSSAPPTPLPGSSAGFTPVAPDQMNAIVVADVIGFPLAVFLYAPIYGFLFNPKARADAEARRREAKAKRDKDAKTKGKGR